MRKRLLVLPVIAAVLTACGGAPQARPEAPAPAPVTPAPPTADLTVQPPPSQPATAPPAAVVPPPVEVAPSAALSRFLDALQAGNSPQVWEMLSQESRREMGGTLDNFTARSLPGLRERFADLKGYRLAVNRQVSPKLAVVGVTSDRPTTGMDVAAVPFVRESGAWKVALSRYPITPLARPGAGLIGYRTTWATAATDHLWLDDLPLTVTRTGTNVTAPLPPALAAGPHVAVALSMNAGGVPTAYGWLYAPASP